MIRFRGGGGGGGVINKSILIAFYDGRIMYKILEKRAGKTKDIYVCVYVEHSSKTRRDLTAGHLGRIIFSQGDQLAHLFKQN